MDKQTFDFKTPDQEDHTDIYGHLINQQPVYSQLLNLQTQNEAGQRGKVVRCDTVSNGSQMGTYDQSSLLNIIMYEEVFDDGAVKEYGVTAIAEKILSRVYNDDFLSLMLKAIVDHKRDRALAATKKGGTVKSANGQERPRKTTKGWQLKIPWDDDMTSWINLK